MSRCNIRMCLTLSNDNGKKMTTLKGVLYINWLLMPNSLLWKVRNDKPKCYSSDLLTNHTTRIAFIEDKKFYQQSFLLPHNVCRAALCLHPADFSEKIKCLWEITTIGANNKLKKKKEWVTLGWPWSEGRNPSMELSSCSHHWLAEKANCQILKRTYWNQRDYARVS